VTADNPTIHEIKVLVELDDEKQLDLLVDRIGQVCCDKPHDTPEEKCTVPWFIVASPLDDDEAASWRDELNR
jgi:hypothetical protein